MPDQGRAERVAVREDFLDYPTAWFIQGEGIEHFSTACSAVPPEEGGHPLGGPGLLCDCGAVGEEWARRVASQKAERRRAESGNDQSSNAEAPKSVDLGPKEDDV